MTARAQMLAKASSPTRIPEKVASWFLMVGADAQSIRSPYQSLQVLQNLDHPHFRFIHTRLSRNSQLIETVWETVSLCTGEDLVGLAEATLLLQEFMVEKTRVHQLWSDGLFFTESTSCTGLVINCLPKEGDEIHCCLYRRPSLRISELKGCALLFNPKLTTKVACIGGLTLFVKQHDPARLPA